MAQLWDPLTYDNLMAGTVAHFEQQERRPFGDIAAIEGPGVDGRQSEAGGTPFTPADLASSAPHKTRPLPKPVSG